MLYLATSSVLIALMCFCSYSNALEVQTYRREWTSDLPDYLVQGTLFITDYNTYPHAVCETRKPNVEKVCNVTLVVQSRKDRTCTGVKIFAGKGRELFLGGFFQVLPYTPDHVLLIWYDNSKENQNSQKDKEQNFKVSILDVNKCKAAHLDFPIDKIAYSFFPAIVPYVNRIDVIINSKEKCAAANRCKLSYDLNGKQLGGVQPYLPKICQYANPVSVTAPEKGYFMIVQNLETITVLIVNAAGKSKQLGQATLEKEAKAHHLSFSSTHELYSACRMPDLGDDKPTFIHCAQFDGMGNTKINITSINILESTGWLGVHSVAKGVMLVATASCAKQQSAKCGCHKFRVWKITANEPISKPLKLKGPDVNCADTNTNLQVRISENKKDEYCFEFSCLSTNSTLTYVSKCIPRKSI